MSDTQGILIPIRKVVDLKTRRVPGDRAKRVKGGPYNPPWRTSGTPLKSQSDS